MSDRLIERWINGTASAEDRAELVELIEQDPALVDRLFRAAERDCDLTELFRGLAPISPSAQASAPRSTRARRGTRTVPWAHLAGGLAALLFVTVLAFQVGNARGPATMSDPQPAPVASATPPAPTATEVLAVEWQPLPLAVDERTTLAEVFAEPLNDQVDSVPVIPALPSTIGTTTRAKPPMLLADAIGKPTTNEQQIDRVDGELKDADGSLVMRYSLRAPRVAADSPTRLGLLLCFHGAGGSEQWLADPMLKALRTQGEVQFVVAALKSRGANWEREDESNIVAFIDWAKRTYPIDPRRVVIQGTSNGGWMVSYFGSRHPDLIAGVVTLCGGNGFEAPAKRPANAAETGFEYYIVHGTADEDVNVKHGRGISAALRTNGFRYVYRELPGVGHDVWSDERTRRDFAGWLTRLRHKTMPLTEAERKTLSAFSRRDEAERLLVTDAGAAALVRIGGLPAEKILVRALRSRQAQVRATAVQLFAHTATMPGATALIAGLLNDKDAQVRSAVIATLARAADWNDQDALRALCRFAGTRGLVPGERQMVLTALTASFTFRCSPSPDNHLIYETLVHLLEDDEPTLRSAAIAALPTVDPPRFAYDPSGTPSERRESVHRWQRWFRHLVTPDDERPEPRR
jgi:predicted esterase